METFQREVFEGGRNLLPEVPACGRSVRRTVVPGLDAHRHDAFEICLISAGEVEWWAGDQLHLVAAGDVFVTRPGETHGAVGGVVQPCELYWFQLRQPEADAGAEAEARGALKAQLEDLPRRAFAASGALQAAIRRLVEEHRGSAPHRTLMARAALDAALVLLVREAGAAPGRELSPIVRRALRHMSDNADRALRLGELCARVGMSQARLQARFRAELGCSIAAYDLRLRMHRAKALLAETETPITEIALALGFSSSQYLATAFRRHAGLTPSEYRRRRREPPPA